jgi:hypothetical protein
MPTQLTALQVSPLAFASATDIVPLPPGALTHTKTTIRPAGVESGVVLNLWTQHSAAPVAAANPANHALIRDTEIVHNVGEDPVRELHACTPIPPEHRFIGTQADNLCCLADVLFLQVELEY